MEIESWQIYHVAKKKLPRGRLQNIYRRSTRLVELWAANPRECDVTARNPLDRTRMLLAELDDVGYGDYARAAIDYMAEPLGGQFGATGEEVSDKGIVDGEIADATITMGDLSAKIRAALEDNMLSTVERIAIKDAARNHVKEINQLLDAAGISGVANVGGKKHG